jgi:hypothetical protein
MLSFYLFLFLFYIRQQLKVTARDVLNDTNQASKSDLNELKSNLEFNGWPQID